MTMSGPEKRRRGRRNSNVQNQGQYRFGESNGGQMIGSTSTNMFGSGKIRFFSAHYMENDLKNGISMVFY